MILPALTPKSGNTLFVNIVGSRMWDSARPDSDTDLFVCYCMSPRDLLLNKVGRSYERDDVDANGLKMDIVFHELGTVGTQLLKGNPNFLIGLYSPKTVYDFGALAALRVAMKRNVSLKCFPAFRGYGKGHYLRYIESGKDTSERRCNIAVRFFNFGVDLLMGVEPRLLPVSGSKPEDVFAKYQELEAAYLNSPIPESPMAPDLVEDWIIRYRLEGLKGASSSWML